MEKLTYSQFRDKMIEHNRNNRGNEAANAIEGVVVITADSFSQEYSLEARSYGVSSNNKAFIDGMSGYSIFASSLDGSDPCVRLEAYLKEERGGAAGWKVEYCYFA